MKNSDLRLLMITIQRAQERLKQWQLQIDVLDGAFFEKMVASELDLLDYSETRLLRYRLSSPAARQHTEKMEREFAAAV